MTTVSLAVGTLVNAIGTVTPTGGTVPTIVGDANDATYIRFNTGIGSPAAAAYNLGTFTLGTGRIKSWQIVARFGMSLIAGYTETVQTSIYNSVTNVMLPQSSTSISGPTSGTKAYSTTPYVPPVLTQAEIDGLMVQWNFAPATNTALDVAEAAVLVTYAVAPVANITYPTGTPAIGTSSPTITWTHAPGADGGSQAFYQVRVFTAAEYGIGGFDPLTSPGSFDSGSVASSSTSAAVGPLANSTTYRVYVRTAQTVNSSPHWSPWDFEPFTTSYTPATVSSVTTVSVPGQGYIAVTANHSGATWVSVEIERFDTDGVWRPVRGATGVTVADGQVVTAWSTSAVTARDYEAGNGSTVTYRARGTTSTGTVGPWTSSSATSWADTQTVWLKDPGNPALNVPVLVTDQPQPTRSVTQGIFDVIGARYPVVVSDVRRSRVGGFECQTQSLLAGLLFEAAIENQAKLLQFPASHLWGSKYIALSDVQELYVDPSVDIFYRQWQVAFVEIDRPADETNY